MTKIIVNCSPPCFISTVGEQNIQCDAASSQQNIGFPAGVTFLFFFFFFSNTRKSNSRRCSIWLLLFLWLCCRVESLLGGVDWYLECDFQCHGSLLLDLLWEAKQMCRSRCRACFCSCFSPHTPFISQANPQNKSPPALSCLLPLSVNGNVVTDHVFIHRVEQCGSVTSPQDPTWRPIGELRRQHIHWLSLSSESACLEVWVRWRHHTAQSVPIHWTSKCTRNATLKFDFTRYAVNKLFFVCFGGLLQLQPLEVSTLQSKW